MSADIRTRERTFTAAIAGLILAVVLVGFSRSFFLRPLFAGPPSWAAKETIFYAHGAIFAAWYAVFGVQVALIRARNVKLHRRLGYAGAGLAVLVVAAGTLAALRAANRAGGFIDVPFPPAQFLTIPLLSMALFALFVTLAVVWRRRHPDRHKRLMFLACISLLGAPVARLTSMAGTLAPPMLDVIVYAVLVAAMVVWDAVTQRRLRADTAIGGGAIVVLNAVAIPFGATAAWLAIAHRLMSLVPAP